MTANQIAYWNMMETKRSNQAREALTGQTNQETARHNRATEAYSDRQLSETKRANLANEFFRSAETEVKQAAQRETERSNLAKEAETRRSNLAREGETTRSNLASERDRARQRELDLLDLEEQWRRQNRELDSKNADRVMKFIDAIGEWIPG